MIALLKVTRPRNWFLGFFLCGWILFPSLSAASENDREKAFEHNRQGMILMSMARFEEALGFFQKASALVNDYGILGEKLEYTPVFHSGWVYEKLGDHNGACQAFRHFLGIAPPTLADKTKIKHSEEFIRVHCSP